MLLQDRPVADRFVDDNVVLRQFCVQRGEYEGRVERARNAFVGARGGTAFCGCVVRTAPACDALGYAFVPGVVGAGELVLDGYTPALNDRLLRLIVENLPNGSWELVCHPGYNDADLQRVHTRLRQSREWELRILTSESTRELLAANGIQVISYRELVGSG